MHQINRAGAIQVYAHSANASFADKIALALDAASFDIVTGPFNALAVDAVIVVWSGAAMGSERLLSAAKTPLAAGVLVPVSIGRVEPPLGFQHIKPVNLGGWTGDPEDPRWRSVLEELERVSFAVRGLAPLAPEPGAAPEPEAAPPRLAVRRPPQSSAAIAEGMGRVFARVRAGAAVGAAQIAARLGAIRARAPALSKPALAGTVAVSGAVIAAAFLLLAPNADPEIPVAASVPAEAPLLAALAPAPPPAAETVPEQNAPAAIAEEGPSPEEGEIIGEGDAEYAPAPSASQTEPAAPAFAATPSLAPARLAPVRPAAAPDQIASLIESSAAAVPNPDGLAPVALGAGFRDCAFCPVMQTLPAGRVLLGSPANEPARQVAEGPQVEVEIARPFAIGAMEVTFAEWDVCVADGGCAAYAPGDAGWGRGKRPVVNVSWNDAAAYAQWLSAKTGERYRLPSEAEWEYAARGGAQSPFSFGKVVSPAQANFDGAHPYGAEPGDVRGRTTPAGAFAANPFGLYDMHGNAWEWVADCWSGGHDSAPRDGAPVSGPCTARVLKGGAWNSGGWRLRAGHRIAKAEASREFDNGFRLARDIR